MGLLFKDDLLDEFGSWPIAYIPYGGADFGEIAAVAKAVRRRRRKRVPSGVGRRGRPVRG